MNLNKTIEHTLLRPDCTLESVKQLCTEALQNEFYGVCVPPFFVQDAVRYVNEVIKVITVIGFPMGYSTIPAKVEEIKRTLDEGADEVDMVVNIAAIKSRNWNHVRNEIDSTMRAVSMKGKTMKLIIEIGLLTPDEILKVLSIAEENGVHFIKTSTGINSRGATVEDIVFLRKNMSKRTKIKASGGIKTREQAEQFLAAGADRIGTSNGLEIIK